jgi:NAD(P)-dependent dehydrogenase (short-subunit alcohol dehydrogenase family)
VLCQLALHNQLKPPASPAYRLRAATVELFRREGARLVGVDVVASDGVAHCDVTDQTSVRSAMEAAVAQLGGIDVCANVARINIFFRGLRSFPSISSTGTWPST